MTATGCAQGDSDACRQTDQGSVGKSPSSLPGDVAVRPDQARMLDHHAVAAGGWA